MRAIHTSLINPLISQEDPAVEEEEEEEEDAEVANDGPLRTLTHISALAAAPL